MISPPTIKFHKCCKLAHKNNKLAQYSISDLEKHTGVKAHTLRTWEKRYGICKPVRDVNNTRKYTETDLQHLIKISYLNKRGHRISSIACLPDDDIDRLYRGSLTNSDSGCCVLDKLTLAVEKTQESKLYVLLKERLEKLGVQGFAKSIWEPMQERLGFLVLSGGLHKIHLRLFDQIVERLLEADNIDLMLNDEICNGSALLINTCGKSTSVFHHITKRILIENHIDVVSLSLCQSDWTSLTSILKNRNFHQVFIHYQTKEFSSPPPYHEVDSWIAKDVEVIIYGSDLDKQLLPERWRHLEMMHLLNYITAPTTYNNTEAYVESA